MKKVLIIAGIFLAVILMIGGFAFFKMTGAAKEALDSMVYEKVDINRVADGSYTGEADAGLVYAKVIVTVKDHRISNIQILEHRNGQGAKAESIAQTMLDENSYEVDAISGATLSSETIKSAVSKALKFGMTE